MTNPKHCPICNRPPLPLSKRDEHDPLYCERLGLRLSGLRSDYGDKDCAEHAVDWRAGCLARDAVIADLTAKLKAAQRALSPALKEAYVLEIEAAVAFEPGQLVRVADDQTGRAGHVGRVRELRPVSGEIAVVVTFPDGQWQSFWPRQMRRVHRDVKPDNVIQPPAYMAPEQLAVPIGRAPVDTVAAHEAIRLLSAHGDRADIVDATSTHDGEGG